MKGYVPLRRGLLEHLPGMSGAEVKAYIAIIIQAKFKPPNSGEVVASVRDLAADLHTSPSHIANALRALSEPHGSSGVRYIEYQPGRNQHSPTIIRVLKYGVTETVTPPVTAGDTAPAQHPHSDRTAPAQHDGADLREQALKNGENGENGENDTPPRAQGSLRADLKAVGAKWEKLTASTVPAGIVSLCDDHPTDRLLEALRLAAEADKVTVSYIAGICRRLAAEGWKPGKGGNGKRHDPPEPKREARPVCEACGSSVGMMVTDTGAVPCPVCNGGTP